MTHDWYILVCIYEKGNLYWAEQAKYLQQATSFDLVSLKKQMNANTKTKKESEQKNESLKSSIFDLERRY